MNKTLNSKLYRTPDTRKSRARIFLIAIVSGLFFLLASPDYKGRGWLLTWDIPQQEIGETEGEFQWRTFSFWASFPVKAIRAAIVLNSFKIQYALFNPGRTYQVPESYGAFIVSLKEQTDMEALIVPPNAVPFYFDVDADGDGDNVSWISDNGAMLFNDRNGNGRLDDGSELLDAGDKILWGGLAALDANDDKRIDAVDPEYAQLRFLKGTPSQGMSYPASKVVSAIRLEAPRKELSALQRTQWLSSLSLADPGDRARVFDSSVPVTLANGKDAWLYLMFFDVNVANTFSVLEGEVKDNPALAASLRNEYRVYPNLRGYGRIPDLHVVMHRDPEFKEQVVLFSRLGAEEILLNPERTDAAVQDIILRWVGVEGVDPDGRGPFIDGRHMAFLENIAGQDIFQLGHYYYPMPYGAEIFKKAWEVALLENRARFLLQTDAGRKLFPEGTGYPPSKRDVAVIGQISRNYLDFIAREAREWPRERRRALLQIITDMLHYAMEGKIGAPDVIEGADKARNYAELERFRLRLFPQTGASE